MIKGALLSLATSNAGSLVKSGSSSNDCPGYRFAHPGYDLSRYLRSFLTIAMSKRTSRAPST